MKLIEQLGIETADIANGTIGAIVAQVFRKKLTLWERCLQIFVGGLFAGYAANFVVAYFPETQTRHFATFLTGLTAYYFIGAILKKAKDFTTKFTKNEQDKNS